MKHKATNLSQVPTDINPEQVKKERKIVKSKKEVPHFEVPPVETLKINNENSPAQKKTLAEVNTFFRKLQTEKAKSLESKLDEDAEKKRKQAEGDDWSFRFKWQQRLCPGLESIDLNENVEYFMSRYERYYHEENGSISARSGTESNLYDSIESVTEKVTDNIVKANSHFRADKQIENKSSAGDKEKSPQISVNLVRAKIRKPIWRKRSLVKQSAAIKQCQITNRIKLFFLSTFMWMISFIYRSSLTKNEKKGIKMNALNKFNLDMRENNVIFQKKLREFKTKRKKKDVLEKVESSKQVPLCMGYQINQISNKFMNQLFTPITLGTNDGIDTFIQLDSGAATNLISAKMAQDLEDKGLINFTYKQIPSELTDVQNNIIAQTRKPINVTLWFGKEKSINVCFQVVENLEYPLLGMASMVANNISIINDNNESFLCVGSIKDDATFIRNVQFHSREIFLSDKTLVRAGINKVSCYTSIPNGLLKVEEPIEVGNTVIKIPPQTLYANKHQLELQILNQSENSLELIEDFPIGNIQMVNDQSYLNCNQVLLNTANEDSLDPNEDLDGRYQFPLSEEEGRKLLDSVEPFSFPMVDENTGEEVIDWEEEISKEGVFPKEYLHDFISYIKEKIPEILKVRP